MGGCNIAQTLDTSHPLSGLYIHVPFCHSKCDYCAFASVTRWERSTEEAFVARTVNALGAHRESTQYAATAYIGGGTPSVLRSESLVKILEAVAEFAPNVSEVTLEANPESASDELLSLALASGVTRLSVGVQSFEPKVLASLGRRAGDEGRLAEIRDRWPRALSADLIIDAPGATEGDSVASVSRALEASVEHLSLYSLTLESGTPLAARTASDAEFLLSEAEDDAIARLLDATGLHRYEISNFARSGFESEHNRGYWAQEGYLGLGPSAVSTFYESDGALRIFQPESIEAYVHGGRDELTYERLDRNDLLIEHLMLGLRTDEGINFAKMEHRYGASLWDLAPGNLSRCIEQGMLKERPEGVVATILGWRYLDAVLRSLVTEMQCNLDTLQV